MIENEVYLTHYIWQKSCGWVKVHEYTCNGLAGAKAKEREIRARYPHDVVKFDIRYPRSASRKETS